MSAPIEGPASSAPGDRTAVPSTAAPDSKALGLAKTEPVTEQMQEAARKRQEAEARRVTMLGLQGTGRSANQRRSIGLGKMALAFIAIMLAGFLVFGGMMYSFYQRNIEPKLQQRAVELPGMIPTELAGERAMTGLQSELAATRTALDRANEQVNRLQRQVDALRSQQEESAASLSRLSREMQTAGAPAAKAGDLSPEARQAASAQIASVVPIASPASQELWLLKERNRLMFWADQAIAQGSSEAMDNLWRSLEDKDLSQLRDGVQAEIIRVQNYYGRLSRLPPDYRLPVRDLIKDPAVRSEADLQPDQAIKLLLDIKQPLEVRARAAYVLGGRRTQDVAAALIQAMKTDPVLDVIKEAQRTLEDDYGMHVPPLHVRAAENWWKQYSEAASAGAAAK